MPTYDYKCLKCGYQFEYFQKMTDEPLKTCPKCGGELKRLLGTGLPPIFKGSGFYETDYKHNGSNGSGTSNYKTTKVDKTSTKENKSTEVKKSA
jgi:putative FmdB family regulatory protein